MDRPYKDNVNSACLYCRNYDTDYNTCVIHGSRRAASRNAVEVNGEAFAGLNGYFSSNYYFNHSAETLPSSVFVPNLCFKEDFKGCFDAKTGNYIGG